MTQSVFNSFYQQLRKAMIDTVPVTAAPHGSGLGSQSFEVYDFSVDEV